MNEMELLRELGQQTPLPAPAELAEPRARLAAAIAADPAARRPVPAPVLDAIRLMYGGAAGTAIQLVIALFYLGNIRAYHLTALGHHLTTAQLLDWRPLIVAAAVAAGLIEIALWLGLARAAGRGRNWARILATVLAGLATLQLGGSHGAADLFFAVLTWLTGLAAVWQLWRPAAHGYFRPRALHGGDAP